MTEIEEMFEEIAALRKTVLEYNGALRSAHAIAERLGGETNWPAFLGVVKKVLDDNHQTFVRAMRAVPLPEPKPGDVGGAVGP